MQPYYCISFGTSPLTPLRRGEGNKQSALWRAPFPRREGGQGLGSDEMPAKVGHYRARDRGFAGTKNAIENVKMHGREPKHGGSHLQLASARLGFRTPRACGLE